MIPRPPASLVGVGAEEWTRVVTLLVDRGQWDPLRSTVLLAYCEAYADWHRLSTAARGKELIKQGEKPVPNPLLPVIERAIGLFAPPSRSYYVRRRGRRHPPLARRRPRRRGSGAGSRARRPGPMRRSAPIVSWAKAAPW